MRTVQRRSVILASLGAWLSSAQALDVGQRAPDVPLPGMPGVSKLSDWRGRHVYVDFWASWCGPCRISFPWLGALQARYKPEELTVVAINLDKNRRDADRFLQTQAAPFALAFDPSAQSARAFDVKTMPSSYLISPDGQVLLVHRGFTSEDGARLAREIDRWVRP